ncbi:type IV secretory system conjugative DNA transfer family protein (plasmid) [Asticcacaulis sp. DW145]|uniref:type IV secretory system conjugative DNA transfer family protein n=1 Tax=Asticcacaulis sp. DW145 TaxID=3095608 RepID=UPI003088279F|nr:type IV secretory system conjugative DNA transfer family protein [Asticcacaulis sp. DW145]
MKKGWLILIGLLVWAVAGYFAVKMAAGALYFVFNKAEPVNITLTTWDTYWHFYQSVPGQKKRLQMAILAPVLIVFVLPGILVMKALGGKARPLHGKARFANAGEVRKAGLCNEDGIIVGKDRGSYLIFGGQQFVMLSAPTRSGKGVSVVIPNLLNFSGSVVVLDIKLENFRLTSKFRSRHGQQVFLFNPFAEDFRTHRWNPLDGISRDRNYRVGDILAVGQGLYPAIDGKDNFWNDQARNLFLGLVLYLMETPSLPTTLGEVLRQSSGKGRALKDYLQSIVSARNAGPEPLSEDCLDALGRFCAASENTLSSILATFNAPLTIFANPIVDAATSASDFDIARVRKDLMSIYIGIQPNRLADASLLVNVFFSQLLNLNTLELPQDNPELKHPCLLILDEFTALGRVGIIAKANAFISGYNLRLLTVIQSISQLESVYGEKDTRTLVTNHALQVIFAPREQRDANAYSEMLGTYTERGVSKGTSSPRGGGHGSSSETVSDQRRPLMLPQELKEMGAGRQIILLEGTKPIQCDRIRYFDDPTFMNRLKPLSARLAALKNRLPTRAQLDAAAFIAGELSAAVPTVDMDLHRARTEGRSRPIRPGEAIEVARLDIDASKLPRLDDQVNPSPASVEKFVDAALTQFDALAGGVPARVRKSSSAQTPRSRPRTTAVIDMTAT